MQTARARSKNQHNEQIKKQSKESDHRAEGLKLKAALSVRLLHRLEMTESAFKLA